MHETDNIISAGQTTSVFISNFPLINENIGVAVCACYSVYRASFN